MCAERLRKGSPGSKLGGLELDLKRRARPSKAAPLGGGNIVSFHKTFWVGSASAIAMLGACVPAFAADAASPGSGTAVDEVVVTGIRASLQQSIATKRSSNEIVEVITAEDVGKFPDKNVAESLQRISGIAIQREYGEGERVSIRGTAPVLNLTLLNGAPVATADWFVLDQLKASRSFNYLMLPSEIVGQIQVYKSPSADLDEGGIGGTIDVHTRNPLDLPKISVQASAQGVYDSIAGNVDPAGSAMFSWHNDEDTFGVLVGLIYSKRAFRRDGIEILGYTDYKFTGTDPVTGAPTGGILNADGSRFEASAPNLIGSTIFQQTRIREGGDFAIQYAPNSSFKATLTGLYSHMDADNFNQNYMAWPQQMLNAGAAVTNPVLTPAVGTEGLPTMVGGQFSLTPGANGVVFDAIDRIAHTDTGAINFDVVYQPNSDWKLHFQTGYTKANGVTDQQPFWETNAPTGFTYNVAAGTIPQVHFTDINPDTSDSALALGWTSNNTIKNSDDEFYTFADAERFFDGSLGPLTSIKIGGKYSSHNRDVDVTYGQTRGLFGATACSGHPCSLADVEDGLTPSNFLSGIAGPGTLNSYLMASKDKIEAIYNALPPFAQYGMPPEGGTPGCPDLNDCQHFGPLESFTLNEKTWGGYVMANFGGQGWGGNAGVRVITTRESSGAWAVGVPSGTAGAVLNPFGLIAPISFEKEYTDVLPSFNIHFDLKDDLVWRFAASRAIARPDYAQMAAFTSLTPLLLTASGGNPHVDPYRANQFDTSLEWYFAPQSILAIDFFYKDISSYIVQGSSVERLPAEIPSPSDPRVTNPANDCVLQAGDNYICNYTVGRPVNVTGGVDKGIEVTFQKPIWGGFGVIANYTYQDASSQSGVPIPNFSRHLGNLTGYYENDRLSVRLSGNYRSKYFADYDSERGFLPLYVGSTFSLDGSINVNVTENVALTLDAVNLTNETLTERYYDDPNRPARFYKNGRVLYFGVRAKF
jgi:iron complex outermembrane receptor protein